MDTQLAHAARAVRIAGDIAVYFDPPTQQLLEDRLFDGASNIYTGDNILAPFIAARDRLASEGLEVHTADLLPEAPTGRRNIVVSFGMPDRTAAHTVHKYRRLARRPDVVLSALFAIECPVVEPTLYAALPALQALFRRTLSWSDSEALLPFTYTPVRTQHFCWPQSYDAVHEEIWSRRERKFLLMMNANKLPRVYVGELYTARLDAIEYFQRFGEIDLYGRNWDRMPFRTGKTRTPTVLRRLGESLALQKQCLFPDPRYVAARGAWRGATRSKSHTLGQYRFALCFENSVLKGYMTEKLFDCFFAGTIPVYWGAPEILDRVPGECFIDMRQFKDYAELRAFLHALTPAQEESYRTAARDFLRSERFDPYRARSFADLIAGIVLTDAAGT